MGEGGWGVDGFFSSGVLPLPALWGRRGRRSMTVRGRPIGRHARGIASLSGPANHYPPSRIFLEDGNSCGGHVLKLSVPGSLLVDMPSASMQLSGNSFGRIR